MWSIHQHIGLSEGHRLAERFNRSLSDTLKSMVTQEDPEWHGALPWAKLAYNSAVHAVLSMEGEGISPAEVHLGRRMHLNIEAGLEPWSAAESGRKPAEYAQQFSEHVKATTAWVAECRRKYNANMRRLANKKGRKVQEFNVGQLVKPQAVETKGVERKLLQLRLFDGPYEVVGKDSPTEYTIQRVGEGKRVKVRVHVARLGVYNDLMEMDTRSKAKTLPDAEGKKEEFKVHGGDT